MAKAFIDDANLTAIADAIRIKNGSTDTYLPSAMADAIKAIPSGTGIDTSDATATASDIILDKTAYANGEKITGTIPSKDAETIVPGSTDKIIDAGQYLSGDQTIQGDANLIPENIASGVSIFGVIGTMTNEPNLQTKIVSPNESIQTISPDTDYDGLSSVTVGAIPSTYVGSGVPTQGAKTVTPSTSSQTVVPFGTYVTGNIEVSAMPTGTLSNPTINISTGVVTAGVATSGYLDTSTTKTLQLTTKGATTITPSTSSQTAIVAGTYATGDITVSAMQNGELSTPSIDASTGVVTVGISNAGYLDTSVTKTLQLTTKSAATFTPTTIDQTIDAGQYLTGAQTIQGDANLIPENIASGVSIFGVTGAHQGGSGIDTSDADATDADIVNGKTAYVNGVKLTGTLVVQNYYTGTTTPESTTGDDGDLYFKVTR